MDMRYSTIVATIKNCAFVMIKKSSFPYCVFCEQGFLRIFANQGGGFLRTVGRLRNVPEVLRGNCDLLNVPRGACTFFPEYSARHYNIYTDGRKDKLLYGTEGYAGLYKNFSPSAGKKPPGRGKQHETLQQKPQTLQQKPRSTFSRKCNAFTEG